MIIVCNDLFLFKYVFVLISLLPSVLLGERENEEKRRRYANDNKKTKKLAKMIGEDDGGRSSRGALLDTCFNFPCEVRL